MDCCAPQDEICHFASRLRLGAPVNFPLDERSGQPQASLPKGFGLPWPSLEALLRISYIFEGFCPIYFVFTNRFLGYLVTPFVTSLFVALHEFDISLEELVFLCIFLSKWFSWILFFCFLLCPARRRFLKPWPWPRVPSVCRLPVRRSNGVKGQSGRYTWGSAWPVRGLKMFEIYYLLLNCCDCCDCWKS